MDRGYLDFRQLYRIHTAISISVTRAKRYMDARRVYSAPVDHATGLVRSQTIAFNGFHATRRCPEHLQLFQLKYPNISKTLVFLTHCTQLPTETISTLHKLRWQVELLFRWIRQHLRIIQFYGATENAIKVQI